MKYCLSDESLDVYIRHMGESNGQEGATAATSTKDDKSIIKITAVKHVLFAVMKQALNQRTDKT